MATLRNLAIGLIRQAGYTKIATTIRRIKHDPALLIAILGSETSHDLPERLCGAPCRSPGPAVAIDKVPVLCRWPASINERSISRVVIGQQVPILGRYTGPEPPDPGCTRLARQIRPEEITMKIPTKRSGAAVATALLTVGLTGTAHAAAVQAAGARMPIPASHHSPVPAPYPASGVDGAVMPAVPASGGAASAGLAPKAGEVTPLASYLDMVELKNYHDGKCVEPYWDTSFQQWQFADAACGAYTAQYWYRYKSSNASQAFRNSVNTGLCLGDTDGNGIGMISCTATPGEGDHRVWWKVGKNIASGTTLYYQFINYHTGACLTEDDFSGRQVFEENCEAGTGDHAQFWRPHFP